MRQRRRPYRDADEGEDAISENLAAVNDRLDELTQQLERMTKASAGKPSAGGADEPMSNRVADALARLDRRLDQVIQEGRATSQEMERRARPAPAPPPPAPPAAAAASPAPSRGRMSWVAQIAARQRALDGAPAGGAPAAPAALAAPIPPPVPAPPAWEPPDLSGVEQQLREINSQISALQQPHDDALSAIRHDLAEIGRTLTEAVPRQAIEALESDLRALAEKLDRTKQAGVDGTALATLERGLDEVRDALRGLTPAENLVGFEEAVRELSHKIDHLAASTQAAQDPLAFKQLEQAVVSLRGVVSNVASDGALEQLSAEVHTLANQFERAAAESSAEALARLEDRIATLMDRGRAMPPELENSIRELSERLDRMQLTQGDQHALVALEDRIAKLSEKLDASDARLRHLEAIERGLADLLVYLEEMRSAGPRGSRPAPAAEPSPQPETPKPPAPAPAASPLDLIPAAPAAAAPAPAAGPAAAAAPAPAALSPVSVPPPPAPPAATSPSAPPAPAEAMAPPTPAKPLPPKESRAPRAPELAPDTPLEPGSGTPRHKPGSPAARIAASEAVLGQARPATEGGSKAAALAAARNAARAAYHDTPVDVAPKARGPKRQWLKWPSKSKKTPKPVEAPPLQPAPTDQPGDAALDLPLSRGKRVLRFIKTLLIAASVAVIVVGAAQTAFELLWPDEPAASNRSQRPKQPAPTKPSRPMPSPEGSLPSVPGAEPNHTGQLPAPAGQTSAPASQPAAPVPAPVISVPSSSSFFDPSTVVKPKPPHPDVTGSIGRQPVQPLPPAPPKHSAATQPNDGLPAGISPALRVAVAAKNPAAEYELAARYAEGRGVPRSQSEAIQWFERAANAGFAPAQFRLGSLHEKGDGVPKDLQAARRLYLAAAGHGHAKAMHNLAVLYAEGIDGKPDYKVAAQWFQKAAGYGVTDSQYNLAILYARGIGVPVNLAESYKWFALAAASGDADAARKRDEIGSRLDPKALAAVRLAVQGFVPEREPEEAVSLKAPPGGWDRAPAAPARPHRRQAASPAQ